MDINNGGGGTRRQPPSRRKNKAPLLVITIVNLCASSYLENKAHDAGGQPVDAVEWKKTKYGGSFPATYSLLPLDVLMCDEVGSELHAFIKELVIRWVKNSSETYSNESQHLAEGRK